MHPLAASSSPFADLRAALHAIADVVADILARHAPPERLAAPPNESNGPTRPAAKRRHRRAPPMPPEITSSLDVSDANRERARQALLRRGVAVRPKEDA